MKVVSKTLLAMLLGAAFLSACGEKAEAPAEVAAPAAAPAAEAPKPEPVKEEPGGWVPPAEDRVPGITVPADGAAAPAEAAAAAPADAAAPAAPAAEAEKAPAK